MPSTTAATIDALPVSRYPRSMVNLEEQAILEKIHNGDESGFEVLVKEHTGKIVGLAWRLVGNREEAENMAQEAMQTLRGSLQSLPAEQQDRLHRRWEGLHSRYVPEDR